jgi:hypothetical protein
MRIALLLLVVGLSPAFVAAAEVDSYWYFVFCNPVEGKETEFNSWYAHKHGPDMVANADVASAQRYVATELDPRTQPPRKYLAIYRILSSDLSETFRGFRPSPEPPQSQPIAPDSIITYTYRLLGAEVAGAGAKSFGTGTLKTYAFFVRNGPFPGRDADYNDWYEHTHEPDVAATPGVVRAQRFIFSDVQRNSSVQPPPTKYLVMYTVVTDDLAAFFASLDLRAKHFIISPAFDPKTSVHFTYEALGPLIEKDRKP